MNKKTAVLIFLGVCVLLAVLLATGAFSPVLSGSIFAVALIAFGMLSRGFTK
jgi:hypothetical protein